MQCFVEKQYKICTNSAGADVGPCTLDPPLGLKKILINFLAISRKLKKIENHDPGGGRTPN